MANKLFIVTNDEGDSWLSQWEEASEGYTSRPATESYLTLKAMAEFCDQGAENENLHGMVGSNERLAEILVENVGKKKATSVFKIIFELGGVQALGR